MPIVRNPLLSLSATGKFAERLTFKITADDQRVSVYSRPTGEPTEAQKIRRVYMGSVSTYWKTLFNQPEIVASWKLYAKTKTKWLSAANFFIRSALSLAFDDPAPSFCAAAASVGRVALFWFLNPYSGAATSEPGEFNLLRGVSLNTMIFQPPMQIAAGMIVGPVAPAGGTFFYQLFKAGIPRSGIIVLTQTQAATYDQLIETGLTWEKLLNAGITWDDLL